jgi:ATP-dependent Clp protease ATP-binding subunit ClpC
LIMNDPDLCPKSLFGARLLSLDLGSLVAGTKYRGEFEERLQSVLSEVTDPATPHTVLFIDELHTLVGAGGAEGGIDAANMLKPALARGKVQIIGATTTGEYRKYIEKDAALERRFQPVNIGEPSVEETTEVLEGIKGMYEEHHGVRYAEGTTVLAARLSDRYVTDRFLPDKAIDIMDEAGAKVAMEGGGGGGEEDEEPLVVEERHVYEVVSEATGVPVGDMGKEEAEQLMNLEATIARRLKGQERAVSSVCRALRRSRSGLRDASKPIASYMFAGPTGTGKTELCKALAAAYYGSEGAVVRVDMSEYMERHAVSRLTGPPPGYVGYEEGGTLTNAVRKVRGKRRGRIGTGKEAEEL